MISSHKRLFAPLEEAEMKKMDPVLAWCLYDVGNSAFATTVMAVIYPVFFQSVAASNLEPYKATAFWGYGSSLGLLIGAVCAPFIGTWADMRASRKKSLLALTALGSASSMAMAGLGEGDWVMALGLLVLGTLGFSGSSVCYDSLLPHIVPLDRLDYVSTKGYALGYLGGGALLGLNLLTLVLMPKQGFRVTFLSVGLWWAAFSMPLLRSVEEPPPGRRRRYRGFFGVIRSFKRTFKEIRKYKDLFAFLGAFWLYNDGIGTVIRMAAVFGSNLGIDQKSLVGALLATQFIGIPFSFLFGKLAEIFGSKRTLIAALSIYIAIALGAYWMETSVHFWLLAVTVGTVQGGTQAISRSLYASMVPPSRSGEFFGFYDVSSKLAGVIGPTLFGVITQITGSPRLAVAALSSAFVLGLIMLRWVDVERGRKYRII